MLTVAYDFVFMKTQNGTVSSLYFEGRLKVASCVANRIKEGPHDTTGLAAW